MGVSPPRSPVTAYESIVCYDLILIGCVVSQTDPKALRNAGHG